MFYSKSKNSFYLTEIHGDNIPEDCVEITTEKWQELLDAKTQGKVLAATDDGYPIAVDKPEPTSGQLVDAAKNKRDRLLADTDWMVLRHRDQVETKFSTTLTTAQYTALQNYRAALRNLPEKADFPTCAFPTFSL